MTAILTAFHDFSLGCITSYITVLSTIRHLSIASTPSIYWAGVLSSHLPSCSVFTCVPAACELNTLLCSTEHSSVHMSSNSFPNLLSELLLHCYQCIVDVSCVACVQFAHLHYLHYVWLPIVICAEALYNHSMHPWSFHCRATVDPTGKEIESLWVSLPYLVFIMSCP